MEHQTLTNISKETHTNLKKRTNRRAYHFLQTATAEKRTNRRAYPVFFRQLQQRCRTHPVISKLPPGGGTARVVSTAGIAVVVVCSWLAQQMMEEQRKHLVQLSTLTAVKCTEKNNQ